MKFLYLTDTAVSRNGGSNVNDEGDEEAAGEKENVVIDVLGIVPARSTAEKYKVTKGIDKAAALCVPDTDQLHLTLLVGRSVGPSLS